MITTDGWSRYNIWEHSATVLELYTRRARGEAEEMTCSAQAAKLLSDYARPGQTVLDVGCGTGYFYHSLRLRGIPVEYYGIDATARFIQIGRAELSRHGLSEDRLRVGRIEDMGGSVDHVVCMNVLSNLDNFYRPLERMLNMARRSVILRESIKDGADYRYVVDAFLDGEKPLRVHVNAYDRAELRRFGDELGFDAQEVLDERTQGRPENVIGYPHYWTFMVFHRRTES